MPRALKFLRRLGSAAALLGIWSCSARAALTPHPQRSSPLDLEVAGAGPAGYLSWEELRSLPVTHLRITGEFLKGGQEVTVVFLQDLWKALDIPAGDDCLLAACSDGYAGIFPRVFVAAYRPFIVLEIDGQGPARWPLPGMSDNPGPYAITVSAGLVPAAARFPDIEHKKPWGVGRIEFARFSQRFAGIYTGPWASLSRQAELGRTIWINSCASCHQGPGGAFGGTKSEKPFRFLAAIARADPEIFRRYVRDPKSVIRFAQMEPHPHYTDAQLDQLIAFVTAAHPP